MSENLDNLFTLNDKVIVVTGATGLLGKRHAEAIAAYGGNPVLLDLSKEAVENFAKELNEQFNINAKGFSIDITNETQVEENAKLLIKLYGKIDGLVNNAANNPAVEENSSSNFIKII